MPPFITQNGQTGYFQNGVFTPMSRQQYDMQFGYNPFMAAQQTALGQPPIQQNALQQGAIQPPMAGPLSNEQKISLTQGDATTTDAVNKPIAQNNQSINNASVNNNPFIQPTQDFGSIMAGQMYKFNNPNFTAQSQIQQKVNNISQPAPESELLQSAANTAQNVTTNSLQNTPSGVLTNAATNVATSNAATVTDPILQNMGKGPGEFFQDQMQNANNAAANATQATSDGLDGLGFSGKWKFSPGQAFSNSKDFFGSEAGQATSAGIGAGLGIATSLIGANASKYDQRVGMSKPNAFNTIAGDSTVTQIGLNPALMAATGGLSAVAGLGIDAVKNTFKYLKQKDKYDNKKLAVDSMQQIDDARENMKPDYTGYARSGTQVNPYLKAQSGTDSKKKPIYTGQDKSPNYKSNVTIDGKQIGKGSQEYKDAYDSGNLMSVDYDGMPVMYSNQQAEVTAEAPAWLKQQREREKDPVAFAVRKGTGDFAKGTAQGVGTALTYAGEVMNTPLAMAGELLSGRNDYYSALPNLTRSMKDMGLENQLTSEDKQWLPKNDQMTPGALVSDNPLVQMGIDVPLDILTGKGFKALTKTKDLKNLAKATGKYLTIPRFKSEIDWSKWNKEIPDNKPLMKEYNAIEKQTKADKTWMKNPDGTPYQGTPEQFVQENSENFKKAFPEGYDKTYRGSQFLTPKLDRTVFQNKDVITFGTSNESVAKNYATYHPVGFQDEFQDVGKDVPYWHPDRDVEKLYEGRPSNAKPGIYEILYPTGKKTINAEGQGNRWFNIKQDEVFKGIVDKNYKDFRGGDYREYFDPSSNMYYPDMTYGNVATDDVAEYMIKNDIPVGKVSNVYDGADYFGNPTPAEVTMLNTSKIPVKSRWYNNGMFDMTNPNIFKGLAALVATGTGLSTLDGGTSGPRQSNNLQSGQSPEQKRQGGIINPYLKAQYGTSAYIPGTDYNKLQSKPPFKKKDSDLKNAMLSFNNMTTNDGLDEKGNYIYYENKDGKGSIDSDLGNAGLALMELTGIPSLVRVAKDPVGHIQSGLRIMDDMSTFGSMPSETYSKQGDLSKTLDVVGAAGTVMPFVKPVASGINQAAKTTGKFLTTKTPLKNTYKINPFALKEGDVDFLYRWQADEVPNFGTAGPDSKYTGKWATTDKGYVKEYLKTRPGSGYVSATPVPKGMATLPDDAAMFVGNKQLREIERIIPDEYLSKGQKTYVKENPFDTRMSSGSIEDLMEAYKLSDQYVKQPTPNWLTGYGIKNNKSLNIFEPSYMSLDAPKGNMYGQNQVLTQQSRLLNPKIKEKYFKHQAPPSGPKKDIFEKMPSDYNNRITRENYEDFVNNIHGSTDYSLAKNFNKQPGNLGIGNYGKPGAVFSDAPLNNLEKDIINAHEKNHGIFAGTLSKEMKSDLTKPFSTNKPIPNYSDKHQADEVLARMTQFKNAVGIGDNQVFTLGHLNLIRKNYAKSFTDNSITEMLSKIKPGSIGEKQFLKNMNKYAFGIGVPATVATGIGTSILENNKVNP